MVFIVAEIGVNWQDIVEAKRMIEVFRESGADACKFQMYKETHVARHPRAEELKKILVTEEIAKELIEHGATCDIEVFFTPMYTQAVDILEKLDVNRYKVRSGDATNTSLLRKVLETRKDVMISVAGDRLDWNALDEADSRYRVQLLYCIARYPAKDSEVHLKTAFPSQRPYISSTDYAGLSDHTTGITCAIAASAMGAQIIEKHVKLGTSYNWIDDEIAVTPLEFKEMVYHIRRIEEMRR